MLGKDSGNGGKVVLWSDSQTTFAHDLRARRRQRRQWRLCEVSSKGALSSRQRHTRAPNGLAGTAAARSAGHRDRADGTMTVAALQSALASSNVVLSTGAGTGNGDITVANAVSWSSGNSLTLECLSQHPRSTTPSPTRAARR